MTASAFFEDFSIGGVIQHARGKTVGETEVAGLCHLVMNTAEAHFNSDRMADSPFFRRICFGGINLSLVIGLAAQDTAENAVEEIGLDAIVLSAPVFEGDTIYAFSEVMSLTADRTDSGVVRFRHWGVNQRGEEVCRVERLVRIMRRASDAVMA